MRKEDPKCRFDRRENRNGVWMVKGVSVKVSLERGRRRSPLDRLRPSQERCEVRELENKLEQELLTTPL